jgi:tetratricopeptide (TPR) repeat protein
VNGAPVTDKKSVVRAVSAAAPGSAITLMFQAAAGIRGGRLEEEQVASAHPAQIEKLPESTSGGLDRYSVTLQRTSAGFGMDITESGHVVRYHGKGGPAEVAGVPLDSRIVMVDGTEVASKLDIAKALKALYMRTQHDATTNATFIFQVETSLNRIMSSVDAGSSADAARNGKVNTNLKARKNSLLLAGQAEMHMAGDRHDMALKTYTEALTLDPSNVEIRKGVVRCVQMHRQVAGSPGSEAMPQRQTQSFALLKRARGFGVTCADNCVIMACTGVASKANVPQFGRVVAVNGTIVRSNDEVRGCLFGVDSAEFEVELPHTVTLTVGSDGSGLVCDRNGIVSAVSGPAEESGITVRSCIVAIDGQAVESALEISDRIVGSDSVQVTLLPADTDERNVESILEGEGEEEEEEEEEEQEEEEEEEQEQEREEEQVETMQSSAPTAIIRTPPSAVEEPAGLIGLNEVNIALETVDAALAKAPDDVGLLMTRRYVLAARLAACRLEEHKAEDCFVRGDLAGARSHFEAANALDPTGDANILSGLEISRDLAERGATVGSFYTRVGL